MSAKSKKRREGYLLHRGALLLRGGRLARRRVALAWRVRDPRWWSSGSQAVVDRGHNLLKLQPLLAFFFHVGLVFCNLLLHLFLGAKRKDTKMLRIVGQNVTLHL